MKDESSSLKLVRRGLTQELGQGEAKRIIALIMGLKCREKGFCRADYCLNTHYQLSCRDRSTTHNDYNKNNNAKEAFCWLSSFVDIK